MYVELFSTVVPEVSWLGQVHFKSSYRKPHDLPFFWISIPQQVYKMHEEERMGNVR